LLFVATAVDNRDALMLLPLLVRGMCYGGTVPFELVMLLLLFLLLFLLLLLLVLLSLLLMVCLCPVTIPFSRSLRTCLFLITLDLKQYT
jgi:hypothetical protein